MPSFFEVFASLEVKILKKVVEGSQGTVNNVKISAEEEKVQQIGSEEHAPMSSHLSFCRCHLWNTIMK